MADISISVDNDSAVLLSALALPEVVVETTAPATIILEVGSGAGVTRAEYLALLARVEALEAGTAVPDGTLHIDGYPLMLDGGYLLLQ